MSYPDSKLLVATLAVAIARRWPDVLVDAGDPEWAPPCWTLHSTPRFGFTERRRE